MDEKLTLIGMKSRTVSEQKEIINRYVKLNYDSQELSRIVASAENLLDRKLDGSIERVIQVWILGVLAADIGTAMHPGLRTIYLEELEHLCSEVGFRLRDAITLSVKGDEMAEWFENVVK